ncbi:alkylbase DNA N-glycosylase [Coprinopsis cinerea okayama7|uniref:Alkylbase DNA N-glycosylase n=1 Tax=Coprinopsis cinerea (strain Okayama-7 / 130 / ATCC MYA-4618 / FGSC 9003) TaxID=240176 RepID=A8N397_COPC7|nr:alkylbase DNA N-glycosylase [Coprinopsis cinerea okayama7\|eukprot:XP_001829342.1 alkylbase DNA N-glycosylase [Coprinopsis cinerea okayama7\
MTSNAASDQQPNSQPKRMNKMASNQTINLNHLLNFTLPPRQTRPLNSIPRRSRKTGNVHGVWNKERFVNAQYRFVMNPNGDYTVHFADPDIYFQWQDILQIIVPRASRLAGDTSYSDVTGLSTCPICLSPPTAPRMTKCGHVFCLPCILHYLSTSDNKWARCPICFDSVNERQLKCVKWYEGPIDATSSEGSSSFNEDPIFEITPRAGNLLRMRLIQRPQITTLALPRSQTWPSDLLPPHKAPFHFLPDVFSFAKFMLATPEYLVGDLSKELEHLAEERRIMSAMKDDLSVCFLTAAEERVRQQMEKAAALESSLLQEQIDKARRDHKEIQQKAELDERRTRLQQGAPNIETDGSNEVPTELLASRSSQIATPSSTPSIPDSRPPNQNRGTPRQRRNLNPPPPSTSTYYYYQAASGLPIYLHPLDIKILLSHYHSYSSFPDEITVRVEAYSEGTVNDDLRKRCKYLAHLPESADVIFVEADLEGVVGAEGLKNFEGALRTRSTRRKEKARKDDRAKARAEEREKEREREALARFLPSNRVASVPISENWDDSPPLPNGSPSTHEVQSNASTSPAPPIPTGAWGNRSFASALHSSGGRSSTPARRREMTQEEWDAEEMWHELEQRTMNNTGGGKKKKGTRMVVLGGGGSGARRR